MTSAGSSPLHQKLIVASGALLFVSLFLPWSSLAGSRGTESTPGWNGYVTVDGSPLFDGIGVLTGLLATLVMLWELLRRDCEQSKVLAHHCDLGSAVLAGLTCLSSAALFLGALLASRANVGVAPTGVVGSASVGVGALLTLVSGISLATGASLAARAYVTR